MRRTGIITATIGTVAAVFLASMGASSAAGGTGSYAEWTVSGASTSASFTGTHFPSLTGTRTDGSWQVATGASTWLSASTPFGAEYGSSQGRSYLYTSLPLGTGSTTVSLTFSEAPTPGTWAFALGDIDAEDVAITATDASGSSLDVSSWFQAAFNYCAASPKPSACPAGTHADQPSWSSPVLRGSASDTNGAAGWFRPSSAVKTLTLTQTRNVAGGPIYQLWIAADVLASPSPSATSSSPSASASPSPSATETTASPEQSATAIETSAAADPSPEASAESSAGATGPLPVAILPGRPAPPDTPQVIDVIAESGADPASTITEVDEPRHGSAVIEGSTVVYTPDPGFIGADLVVSTVTEPDGSEVKVRSQVSTGLVQRTTAALGLPAAVHAGRTTTLVDHPVRTNAGQRATVRARCVPVTRMQVSGGFTGCVVTRDGARVMVTVAGSSPYRVRVTVTAGRKGDYLPYSLTRAYTVRAS